MTDYVEEFEKLLREVEADCRKQGHDAKMCVYDVGHVTVAYLCKDCQAKFRDAWNKRLKEIEQ